MPAATPTSSKRGGAIKVISVLALWCPFAAPVGLRAQFIESIRFEPAGAPHWTEAWSPLVPIAELPRTLAGSGLRFPSLLTQPATRIGLFWTAGNPGALAREVGDQRTEFLVGLTDESGDYHRPFDPGAESHRLIAGQAWGAMGARGTGIARIAVDGGDFDDGAFADVLVPYASEPFTVIDTLGEKTSRTAVRLEGAGAWQHGSFAVGLGLGYVQQETRTVESAVPILNRTASPGVTGGVTYGLRGGSVRIGAFGRWQQTAETVAISSIAAVSRVYRFTGFDDPEAINLVANFFTRRFDRHAWAAGGVMGAELAGFSAVLFLQREHRLSKNFNILGDEGVADRWDAAGWMAGAALQSAFAARRLLVTIEARYSTLNGEEELSQIDGVPFSADETSWNVRGELRFTPRGGWEAAARLGLTREERTRSDALARVSSDLRSWSPEAALEVARWFGSSIAVGLGGAIGERNPSGSVPDPASMGPVYQAWLAPELALDATAARAWAGIGTVRWQLRPVTALWIQGQYKRISAPSGFLADAPTGVRSGWMAAVGLIYERP